MKTYITVLIAWLFSSLMLSQNGASIEYKITSSTGNNGSIKMNYSETGSVSEIKMIIPQMPGGGITMKSLIKKSSPGIIYSINDNAKTYSESTATDPMNQDNTTYQVKKLGEEVLNGYKCVHVMVTEGLETHEMWNTKDITDYAKYSEAFKLNKKTGSQKRQQALKDAGCDGFPVKMIHINKNNSREGDMTMELLKVEKKTFASSDFEIPSGYTKTAPGSSMMGSETKSQQEIMNMSPEERAKYVEEMKKKYGK